MICLDYVLRKSIDLIKENGFTLKKKKKARSRRYPAETITNADYADAMAFLANTPAQAESLLHSLEHAARGIGLHVNANKTEQMCFKREEAISSLSGKPLKLIDKFTYLSSSISSTISDVNIHLSKVQTVIDMLSILRKTDLFDKIKRDFFQAVAVSILLYGCTTWTQTKRMEKKLRVILNKYRKQHYTKQQLYSHSLPISKKHPKRTRHTVHGQRSKELFFKASLHMDVPVLGD